MAHTTTAAILGLVLLQYSSPQASMPKVIADNKVLYYNTAIKCLRNLKVKYKEPGVFTGVQSFKIAVQVLGLANTENENEAKELKTAVKAALVARKIRIDDTSTFTIGLYITHAKSAVTTGTAFTFYVAAPGMLPNGVACSRIVIYSVNGIILGSYNHYMTNIRNWILHEMDKLVLEIHKGNIQANKK